MDKRGGFEKKPCGHGSEKSPNHGNANNGGSEIPGVSNPKGKTPKRQSTVVRDLNPKDQRSGHVGK